VSWLFRLHETQPVAHAIGALAFVCMVGMSLGALKVRGIGLGTAGVLFAGILVGHFGRPVDQHTLEFSKDLGLIVFVFTIGLQLGPGFFSAMRQQGLKLNALAAAIVLLGAIIAPLAARLMGFDQAGALGVYSGATTNTPSLAAATQALTALGNMDDDRLALPALAYAVTYPAAIAAIIGTLMLIQKIFRIDPAREAAEFAAQHRPAAAPLERRTLLVDNPNLNGVRVDGIPGRIESGVTVARIQRQGVTQPATDSTVIRPGDRLSVVGSPAGLDRFELVIGQRTDEDLVLTESDVTSRRVAVTHRGVLGKRIDELQLGERFGVAVTRVGRGEVELSAAPGLQLKFGDMIQLVGRQEDLDKAAAALGDSVKELNETQFVPFFTGIVLGIALGTMPIPVPGMPQPVQLGLAGGPLVVALLLGRIGRIGRLVWHMPANTNLAFREFGIALFFASVGLNAGREFFSTVFSAVGAQWLIAGVCVTVLPLLLVGIYARAAWKMNFIDLSGLLAGSMTDPPALTFASNLAGSDASMVAYATVYPLTMVLRIVCVQALAIFLFR
jgi:putative transport protein